VNRPRHLLVILDADGTLHAHIVSGEPEGGEPVRLQLAPPAASITIATESSEGKPIEGISMAMRVNGVLFPVEVMSMVTSRTGLTLRSAADGRIRLNHLPLGTYEFWPVRSRSDIEALVSGNPGAAPVVLNVAPGENLARLTFEHVGDGQ
jgi:hypothetical protein